MRKNKKKVSLLLLITLAFALIGCSHQYTMSSNDVYAYNQKLRGPAQTIDATLTLDGSVSNGTHVEYNYSGRKYTGAIQGIYVLWNRDPEIVADASDMFTLISKSGKEVHLTHNCQIYGAWVEVRQVFRPDRSDGAKSSYLAILVVAALLGLIPANIAKKKGHSFGLWWLYGWMLFIVAIIHVQFIEDIQTQNEDESSCDLEKENSNKI